MSYECQIDICLDAVAKFGKENQLHVAIEEMSELQKELCKDLRGKGDAHHIAEEIADVEIMLDQLKIIYRNEADVDMWTDTKLLRLKERITDGEN